MNKDISDKDKKDWEDFLSRDEKLPDKDIYKEKKNISKIKHIDLHGYSLEEANKIIKDFIFNSYNNEISKLIVVTGKGLHSDNHSNPYISKDLSILKHSVPDFIEKNIELKNLITEMKEASLDDGGSGAFYIYLKKKIIIY